MKAVIKAVVAGMRVAARAAIPVLSLSFIFYGLWGINPSISFIVVGAMVWADLTISAAISAKHKVQPK